MAVQISGNDITVPRDGTFSRNVSIAGTLTYEDVTNVDSIGLVTARNGIEIGASPGVGASISVDGNAIFSGITTAETLKATTGIVTTLTATTGIVTSFVTNTAKVGAAVTISESGIEASGIGITCANINGGQIGGRRNILMNGAMTVNQRVQTGSLGYFNPVTSSIYTLDRWKVFIGSTFDTDSAQITKSSLSPDGFSSSMKWDIGNTETPSSNQNCGIEQKIEGQNMQGLAYGTSSAKTMTLSFHVYSNKTGTYCVQLIHADGSKYQLHEYTISSADTWEKKTITIVGNTSEGINDDNTQGMRILWHLTCGSADHVAASSTWTTGTSFYATSNQVNLWDNASNYWYLTGCQLEIGTTATEFEHRSFGEELAICQRYYYKIIGNDNDIAAIGFSQSSSDNYFNMEFPVPMRDYPTLTGSATAARFFSANNGQDFNLSSLSLSSNMTNANPKRVMLYVSQGGTSGGYGGALHLQNEEGYLEFSSEL